MKFTLRSASSAAIIVGLAGAFPAWAQQVQTVNVTQVSGPQEAGAPVAQTAAAPQNAAPTDRVIVTGSLIAGSAEDAALPVEVFTQEDMERSGAPTALEFAKELTISGPTTGESNYFGGGNLTGSPAFNLRGIGTDKTLTLLNGRRMSENLSNIPGIALARTEILKDGAAVTYGADAVGGVVNFITRDNFVGLEVNANYKYVADTNGEYDIGILGGFGEGDSNFLWALEYEHRSRLEPEDREFAFLPYAYNPAPWSPLTNLARYYPATASGTLLAATGPLDFTQASCESQGGVYDPAATGGVQCQYGYSSYYNLVEDQDIFRAFAQINTAISDNMNFHADVTYGQVLVPEQFASPSLPTTQGPAPGAGATFQYYVPLTNPYLPEFLARTGYTAPAGTGRYDILLLRPLAHQGNPVGGRGQGFGNAAEIDNQVWRVSAGLDGDIGDVVNYDFGVTYNQSISEYNEGDILGFRLQDALNGFGGPNCNAVDLDSTRPGIQNPAAAGLNGCLWYNPFSSSYRNQPELGLTNPNYIPGYENPNELVGWLFGDRLAETTINSITYDLVFSGRMPFELPGGEPGWALGAQARQQESRQIVPSDFYNGNIPCAYPDQLPGTYPGYPDCTTLGGTGPFTFYGTNPPDYYDQQSKSYFGELQLPILDALNFQLAVRREEFSGGLSDTIYKASGKWDVFGPLSIRGSYGTNFTAPPITLNPGNISNIVRAYTRVNNNWLAAQEVTRTDVQPETATAWNIGAIWQSQGFSRDHDLSIIVDFFSIETEGEIGQVVTPNEIANAVFRFTSGGVAFVNQDGTPISGAPAAVNNGTALADCAHPLIARVRLNDTATSPGGVCGATTRASDINVVQTEIGNGPGQIVEGFDFQVQYELPVGDGDLTIGVNGTYMTELVQTAKSLDGLVVAPADDRLGFLNFNSVTFAAPEWRANAFVNYNLDRHNVRLTTKYVSGITDERTYANLTAYLPGTTTPIGQSLNGKEIDESLIFDATYLFDITDNLRLSATVANILDSEPPFVRAEFGYDPRLGVDALGRTFEIGVKATF